MARISTLQIPDFPSSNSHLRPRNEAPNRAPDLTLVADRSARIHAGTPEPFLGPSIPHVDDDLHVEPGEHGWVLRVQGSEAVLSTHATKEEALEEARAVAERQDVDVVVHRSDGTIIG